MKAENTFSAQIMRIINKLIFLEKKTILEFQGIKLYPSEIHLMQAVAGNPNLNATEMAKALGVTKGAVSQTVTRLVNKGMVYKTKDPYQKNRLTLNFTDLGTNALEFHAKQNKILRTEYDGYLSMISESDKKIIQHFLKGIELFIDRLG